MDTLVGLIRTVSVVAVVVYILTRSRMYSAVIENRMTRRHKAGIIVLFGLFSIYGTVGGVEILGAIANIRDLGPVIAGLVAGPLAGFLAGLIGAAYRYSQGGFTAVSCSLSTLLAGVLAGLFYRIRKNEFPGVQTAMILMAGIELLHMGLTLLIPRPFDKALQLVKTIIIPMVGANVMGIGLFAFMMQNLRHERAVESTRNMIKGELKAAREIQMGILPKIFPPFPDRPEFDLYAVIEPAREVGGDFYDFFFTDKDHLCFIIGDVSGKGVPASLFMAVTKTLIKARALTGAPPDQILGAVNDELSQDNPSAMFATVFCGILNIRTGDVYYANGGHNPPYIVTPDGRITPLAATDPGPIVGALDGITYRCDKVRLRPGDSIFLYTDGVSEAMDRSESFFTTSRLEEGLVSLAGKPIRETIRGIAEGVTVFCDGAEQSDDITLLMLRYCG
ncbi:MAG: SpoIIE family protein phosphatase [Syntrophorhabdus aromaticivorans]|uniref:SpoIIE family protein phosphatase n=1 Tax=Syntrophorhabdus aromaticivorans TaxID=328301 RepID=A0A351U875_9BACT|nr:SpoIIE family protein phosphatase [Syntrophorhabdus aromaticivorans]HBA56156.1 serine/threonine protein phosphatase [Syntrophorhabdus aromaticivorans]